MEKQQLLDADIIAELGIASLPDDKKAALLASMVDLIQKRVTARLIEGLSEAELGEFTKIAESQDGEALAAFAAARGKNLQDITVEETAKVKGELIERAKGIS